MPLRGRSTVTVVFDHLLVVFVSAWFDNRRVGNRLLVGWLLILVVLSAAHAQDPFDGLPDNFVPDGDAIKQASFLTVDACRNSCATNAQCKAFAFDKAERSCYLYTRVRPGGNPEMGISSSGLAIVPKEGYVSAFKHSSFPPLPPWQWLSNTQVTKSEAPPISVCDLVENPSRYHGRVVRVRGRIHPAIIDTGVALVDSRCVAGVQIELEGGTKTLKDQAYREFRRYLSELRTVEATVSGRFEMILIESSDPLLTFKLLRVDDVVPGASLLPLRRTPK